MGIHYKASVGRQDRRERGRGKRRDYVEERMGRGSNGVGSEKAGEEAQMNGDVVQGKRGKAGQERVEARQEKG